MPEATNHGQLSAAPASNAAVARTSHSTRLRRLDMPEIRRRPSRRSNADVNQVMTDYPCNHPHLGAAHGGERYL